MTNSKKNKNNDSKFRLKKYNGTKININWDVWYKKEELLSISRIFVIWNILRNYLTSKKLFPPKLSLAIYNDAGGISRDLDETETHLHAFYYPSSEVIHILSWPRMPYTWITLVLLHEIAHAHYYYSDQSKSYDEKECDKFAAKWTNRLIKEGLLPKDD